MRNRSPRSFTVEVKFGGRDQRTIIPHRAPTLAASRPAVSWPPPAELQAPAAEPRRILPNLTVPEPTQVETERMQVSEEPRPRRGRPPKVKPVPAEMAEEPIAEPAIEITASAPAPALEMPAPQPLRPTKPPSTLPLGERWKRRLGRWAR